MKIKRKTLTIHCQRKIGNITEIKKNVKYDCIYTETIEC